MIKITLLGEPRSTNNIYKTLCRGNFPTRYMSQEGKTLKEAYQWQIRSQYKGKPIKTPVGVKMSLWNGNKRKNDIDNFNKLVFDALTGLVYEDDSQITELHIIKGYDKENPRVEIEVNEFSPTTL